MRRAGRVAVASLAGVLALGGPASLATAQSPTLSQARGEASGIYVRANDPSLFLDETILAPPEAHIAYARAELERTGTGSALAANGFSEYMNLLGAVPELGPAFLPPEALPVFQLLITLLPPGLAESFSRLTQASVRGLPPQARDATYFPTGNVEGGVMRASLSDGPTARAHSAFTDAPISLLFRASAISTDTRVTTASIGRRADVVSVLRDVTIAEILEIDAIRVVAIANADGGSGVAEGSVTIDGVTVAGLPAVLDDQGLRFADEVVPLSVAPLEDILATAGVTIVAPGSVTTERDGLASSSRAIGPTFRVVAPEGQEALLTLGRSIASSSLVILPSPPTATPPSADSPVEPSAPMPDATPTVPQRQEPVTAVPLAGSAQPLLPTPSRPDTPVVAGPQAQDPAAYALDLERLILADAEARRGIEDLYAMLLFPLFVLGAFGAVRPWRRD